MKFAMNGAFTIGTLVGANIEIREDIGEENSFLFGLTAEQIEQRKSEGRRPWDRYNENPELRGAIDLINSGFFSHGDTELLRPLTDRLLRHDQYLLLADSPSYVNCQDEVDNTYHDAERWDRLSMCVS